MREDDPGAPAVLADARTARRDADLEPDTLVKSGLFPIAGDEMDADTTPAGSCSSGR